MKYYIVDKMYDTALIDAMHNGVDWSKMYISIYHKYFTDDTLGACSSKKDIVIELALKQKKIEVYEFNYDIIEINFPMMNAWMAYESRKYGMSPMINFTVQYADLSKILIERYHRRIMNVLAFSPIKNEKTIACEYVI